MNTHEGGQTWSIFVTKSLHKCSLLGGKVHMQGKWIKDVQMQGQTPNNFQAPTG